MRKLSLFLLLAVLSVACSKDEDAEPATVLSDSNLTLRFDDTHQYTLTKGTETVNATNFKWTSSDTLVGRIDQSGKFSGRRIGQTIVKAVSTDGKTTVESKVTIDPYSTLCTEPVLDFNANQAAVKAKEKRTLVGEDTSAIEYSGENAKLRGVAYLFTKNALTHSLLAFTETQAVADEAVQFLAERYDYVGEDQSIYYFTNNKVVVGFLEEEQLGLVAIYVPFSSGGLRTSATYEQNMKAAFKNELKKIKANFKGI
ncbi:Ig-like domain-containing protein [Dyadobacter sp. CY345]|uniref:Ig-like domain-containing protein n=1 Tax=Dyadobacter sp. CY345 TaxID=2909335 RepID=UPI001F22FC90|nr:Ig-like domain-containing protein [Dyadobacter sp. CY345]MCF2444092.1 Ig-like domain-containing protein [Dyadobacter sp. CY345]